MPVPMCLPAGKFVSIGVVVLANYAQITHRVEFSPYARMVELVDTRDLDLSTRKRKRLCESRQSR